MLPGVPVLRGHKPNCDFANTELAIWPPGGIHNPPTAMKTLSSANSRPSHTTHQKSTATEHTSYRLAQGCVDSSALFENGKACVWDCGGCPCQWVDDRGVLLVIIDKFVSRKLSAIAVAAANLPFPSLRSMADTTASQPICVARDPCVPPMMPDLCLLPLVPLVASTPG